MEKKSNKSISVIDMQEFPNPKQYKKLREACEELGCFRIVNHSIPSTLLADMKMVVRSLLDLPSEIKKHNTHVIADRGYRGSTPKLPFYESLGVYDMASSQALQTFYDQLDATPHQREIIEKYSKAIHGLAIDLGKKMGESLGLTKIDHDVFEEWPIQYRFIKYSFTPETVGKIGAILHSDADFLTILQDDDNVGGLEVLDESSGAFLPVNPLAGTLLVNLGDIAKAWSNGRFCNMKHRVVCNEASTRVSIGTFLLGPNEGTIEAPQELVDSDQHPRLYIPFTYQDYFNNRLSKDLRNGEILDMYCSH
ncbi:2-oxoglutarate-dependent dioxygenase [Quillaja saponaria]|uniref:2-oxoglutarate-dependent dioxygenase DAO n=1 Tax=Quillaja saponaria TaxID=32244 RepID=A0AAD7L7X6_QUISA|nr:2-oxoglutarate-dependent dioxygenase [Quillaja saponaria]